MLRCIWIAALLAITCMVLYLPSITSADRYLQVIRADDAVVRKLWGDDAANRILARMLAYQDSHDAVSTAPRATHSGAHGGVASSIAQANERLFGNPYFRAIDAQMALATYRASLLIETSTLLLVLLVAAGVDGLVLRAVRARELVPHWAELFTLSLSMAMGLACALAVWCFVPRSFEPTYAQLALIALPLLLGRAVANYHSIR